MPCGNKKNGPLQGSDPIDLCDIYVTTKVVYLALSAGQPLKRQLSFIFEWPANA